MGQSEPWNKARNKSRNGFIGLAPASAFKEEGPFKGTNHGTNHEAIDGFGFRRICVAAAWCYFNKMGL